MTKFIINSKNKQQSMNIEKESENVLRSAALLVKTEIRDMLCNNDFYPTSSSVKEQWIPDKLKFFLSFFTTSEVKQESVGQTIVKLATSQTIPPILFALSVELDNMFGSRWLLDELYELGFGVS